jgi:hypothetical protein
MYSMTVIRDWFYLKIVINWWECYKQLEVTSASLQPLTIICDYLKQVSYPAPESFYNVTLSLTA